MVANFQDHSWAPLTPLDSACSITEGKVWVNNVNIYYKLYTQAKLPVVVLISGLGRDHRIWNSLIPYLLAKFSVLVYDNRGSGSSDKPDTLYTAETMADDLFGLLNLLKIKQPLSVVGHSMGGFVAQYLAAKYPAIVDKLVLCSTCIRQSAAGHSYLKQRLKLVKQNADPQTMLREAIPWLYSANFLSAAKVAEMIEALTQDDNPQPYASLQLQLKVCVQHDSSAVVKSIQTPTLIVTGDQDLIMTEPVVKELHAQILNSQLVVIHDAGHMLQIEKPQQVYNILENFLS